MLQLKSTEFNVLMDMLTSHTTQIMRLIADGIFEGEEFITCRTNLQAIQSEIRIRKADKTMIISTPGISTAFAEVYSAQSPPG